MSDTPTADAVIERVLLRLLPAIDARIDAKYGARRARWRINLTPLRFLLARFSEASSYAGLGAILALVGFSVTDDQLATIIKGLAGASALLAIVIKGGAAGDGQ